MRARRIGGGNAALCAALSAHEHGAKVIILERAPEEKRGGNSRFTGGGFRMVHNGLEDVKKVVPDLSADEIARTDFGSYSAEHGVGPSNAAFYRPPADSPEIAYLHERRRVLGGYMPTRVPPPSNFTAWAPVSLRIRPAFRRASSSEMW